MRHGWKFLSTHLAVTVLALASTLSSGCLTVLADQPHIRAGRPPLIGYATSSAFGALTPKARILTAWSVRLPTDDTVPNRFEWRANVSTFVHGKDRTYDRHGPIAAELGTLPAGCSTVRFVLGYGQRIEPVQRDRFQNTSVSFQPLLEGEWRERMESLRASVRTEPCDLVLLPVYAADYSYRIRAASVSTDFYADIPVDYREVRRPRTPLWAYPALLLTLPIDAALLPLTELSLWLGLAFAL